MNDISMKQLRYFKALAQHGHFGRAAEVSAISQPALSMQIRELENILGVTLVTRSSKHIRLTPFGEAFALRVNAILGNVDELGDFARAAHSPFTGQLRLGVIPTVAPYLLPKIITMIGQHYPHLELRPREAVTRKLMEELLDSRLDAALLALPVGEDALEQRPLLQEEFVLARPLRDAKKPVPSAEALRNMQLLLLEEGHCFRDQALAFCTISPAAQRALIEGSSLSTLVQMVGAGLGVTLIPEMAIPFETRAAEVAIARLPKPRPVRTIGMVWRKTNPLAAQMAEIAKTIKKSYRDN